ncbi:MAG: methyltransferase domain-containing protein [Myxococcales bacterium]|nr:methyltransferase domain-containing protein [Myxococcales bacterium]
MIADELTRDKLTADFDLWQRRRGHRYSLDDLATAWVAASARPGAARYLDLGCGIGSVLLMVAWRLGPARLFGVEAQDASFALARRNVADNGLDARTTLVHGDLRAVTCDWPHGACDLVTGTPPYLPLGTALPSADPQRAAARIELRGGVEDYLAAAARVLAEDGAAVVCSDGRYPARVLDGAARAGLVPRARVDVVARAGAGPLFAVWTCTRVPGELAHETVTIRDAEGNRTAASFEMRQFFGLEA